VTLRRKWSSVLARIDDADRDAIIAARAPGTVPVELWHKVFVAAGPPSMWSVERPEGAVVPMADDFRLFLADEYAEGA